MLAPLSLGFSSQSIGATSAPQLVTLSNTGDSSLNISSITVTGDFSQTNTCGSILAANANCSIGVTFTPSVSGNRTGILTVTDNAANVPGSSQTVVLLGVGQAVPVASLSQTTLTFAAQALQTTSAVQAVTLTNTGSAALVISSVTSSGDFGQVNNCPTSVAAGATCTINVTFTPTASGNRVGTHYDHGQCDKQPPDDHDVRHWWPVHIPDRIVDTRSHRSCGTDGNLRTERLFDWRF